MSSSDLSLAIKTLRDLNIIADEETSTLSLGELFDKCMGLELLIEKSDLPSNDRIFQEAVNICIKSLEKCTVMVNELELFGANETIDEIQTNSLKYLLLPVLLGSLNINVQTKELSQRVHSIKIAEVYLKDFLLRCKNYEINETTLRYFDEDLEEDNKKQNAFIDIRQKKMHLYKLKKELEEKTSSLKFALERPDSEDLLREYYMVLLRKWIVTAIEELDNVKREIDILKNIPSKEYSENITKKIPKDTTPLKKMIITKNEIQKKVFGLGYPSIPVMTIDDFYYQRFHNQIKNQKSQPPVMSLQDKALRGEDMNQDPEEIEKEELLDKDDPAALMKARQWDDWKDDNPRGSGNRYNKG